MAAQNMRLSPGCGGGGKEAEELFLLGIKYSEGLDGIPRDINKAIKCYEDALEMGNSKAAINLGTLYRTAFASKLDTEKERFAYMNLLYHKAVEMGCPDGYYFLALSYAEGWGVKKDSKTSDELIIKGMEAGSLPCMADYGDMLRKKSQIQEAKKWLHKSLEGGFSAASNSLSRLYRNEKDYHKMIEVLRDGAKLGDKRALHVLGYTYIEGRDGQPVDKEYGRKFLTIYKTINRDAPPQPVDLDKLCPPREVVPYQDEK